MFAFLFFLTSLFSLLFSSYLGFNGVFFSNFMSLLLFYLSFLNVFQNIFFNDIFYYVKLGKWMNLSNNFRVDFDFLVDNISFSFSFLTISIAMFVYIYTFSYFRFEPLVDRLLVFLNMFIISMVFLVSSGNLISLFLGWEMIGMTSFFLINFWSVRIGTFKSAFKAFSFNKFSDLFLFFSIILIYNLYYSLDIITIISLTKFFSNYYLNFFFFNVSYNDLICFFFLLCAFIKSAQIGGHIWLPDSMEAPVPASALIHSATLVSAGIFLLLRFSPFFELSYYSLIIISVIGSITAFYGGFSSMLQSDTKKILAYSTISHCGFLMVVYTTGVLEYVLIYLYIHGFFKAAVFMCAGNVNRLSKNNQDFRKMGQYWKFLPFDCFLMFIGLINLSGLPFTLGFYIKHALLISLNNNLFFFYFVFLNCFFAALTGVFYSSRLLYYVFFDFKKSKKNLYLYYSSSFLNSKFYSNSSLSSNLAIILIFSVSYIFGFYFLNSYLSLNYSFSSFFSFFKINSFITLNLNSNLDLFNFAFINYVVLILILFLFFSTWRKSAINSNLKNNFFNLILFYLLFFIFK
jgi:NADH:ubiquinone oxidoreductase subunit 5 (subunit L)/multisubunit Na+/H+ antiporter MnhA subunit